MVFLGRRTVGRKSLAVHPHLKMAARGNQTDTATAEVIHSSKLRAVYEYFTIPHPVHLSHGVPIRLSADSAHHFYMGKL